MTIKAAKPSQELIDLVPTLNGTWHGSYAMARCPAHADSKPSLSLRQGDTSILVKCFAGCSGENILRHLRILEPVRGTPAPDYRPYQANANIDRLWDEGGVLKGTLGEIYMRRRNLPYDLEDLRFHPRCPHHPKPDTVFKPAILLPSARI